MTAPRSPKGQDVVAIVRHVCAARARQRLIPLGRRRVVIKKTKDDFRINRYEIIIDWHYATTGNPIEMIDRVLDAVVEFDTREYEERVRKIVEIQSQIKQRAAYLERILSRNEYRAFIASLLPAPVIPVEALAPDHDDLNLDFLMVLEGEGMITKEIPFRL